MNELDRIAIDYHYNTEYYDKLVCTGVNDRDGSAMPGTSEENKRVQQNAYYELGRAVRAGERIGASKKEVMQAISCVMINGLFNYEYEHEKRTRDIPEAKEVTR